jgi:hypothetical protein
MVKALFNGDMDELEFVQVFEDLLDAQLRDAWLEGMAKNGLSEADMTQEFETELGSIIADENAQVFDFAEAITNANAAGEGLDALLSRADLWTYRYQDVLNQATIFTANAADKYAWRLGATEQHCEECAALDGVVATAEDWLAAGLHPQQPPNDMLTCGGWRCDCRFEKTNEPLTEGGIPI